MRTCNADRLQVAVAAGLAAVALLVLAWPAVSSMTRKYLVPADEPADPKTRCALVIGPIHTYCTPTTPARSPR